MCSHIKVWQGCPSVLQPALAIRSIPCLLRVGLPYLVPLACSVIGWEQPMGDAAPPPTQMLQWLSERSSWGPGHPLPPPPPMEVREVCSIVCSNGHDSILFLRLSNSLYLCLCVTFSGSQGRFHKVKVVSQRGRDFG